MSSITIGVAVRHGLDLADQSFTVDDGLVGADAVRLEPLLISTVEYQVLGERAEDAGDHRGGVDFIPPGRVDVQAGERGLFSGAVDLELGDLEGAARRAPS